MKKSVLVIGAGRFGKGVIEGLYERGNDVVAINKNEEGLEPVRDMIVSGIILNVGEDDDKLARFIEERSFDEAVVATGEDFEATLMATQILKEANIRVSVKTSSDRRGSILAKLGADRVIFPERDMGLRLAQQISNEAEIDVLDLPQGFTVEKIVVGRGFHGKTIGSLNTTNRFGISMLLIYRDSEVIMPKASIELQKGDGLVVIGKKTNMAAFEKENFT